MPKTRVLIVDDEPLARERLRGWLRDEPSVEIVGECGSGAEAINALQSMAVDLVFLDMEMPGGNGLQVLAQLPAEKRPAVVFATAHERFAVDAFEVQAVDYLLKPFDRERLQTALRRAEEFLRARRAGALEEKIESLLSEAAGPGKKPERLAVKAEGWQRLIGLLLVGSKVEGGVYAEEEIEIARASGERLLDIQASAEMARRLVELQRQRMVESQVLDRQTRRVLHDDVLPRLHAALLTLSGLDEAATPTGQEISGLLVDVHRQIADLLHAIPPGPALEVGRLGLFGALRQVALVIRCRTTNSRSVLAS